tara:strand:+ start:1689 stop:3839 length:2151 start_codon:yes stop_codon:yes gene_type:complete
MARQKITIPVTFRSDPTGLKNAEKALSKFGLAAAATAKTAVVAVGAIVAVSVVQFAKFDAALNKSIAIMGDVSDAMRNDMSDAARDVAKATTFSAEQAAESFFFLASAGLDAASSVAAMPTVAKFAQAGMFDMALATDLLTDAQSALGLTIRDDAVKNMENMIRVSDVLVKANTLANATVQQFSEALTNKAGAALKIVGKDIEEGVAVLAAFADQGIKGADAGTKFGIVMRDLQTKALKNTEEFRAFNVAVFDSQGEMNNLGDIIGDLEGALDGMSDAQAKATLLTLGFSDKSVAAIQAVIGSSEAIKQYESDLRSSAGTTQEVSEKQLDTLIAQFGLLKSAVADVALEIGEGFEPALKTMAGELRTLVESQGPEFVDLFKDVEESLQPLIESTPALIESALLPVTTFLVDLFLIIMDIVNMALPPLIALLDAFAPVLTDLLPALQDLLEPLLKPMTEVFMVFADALVPLVDTLVPALVNIMEVLGGPLVDVLIILLKLVEIAIPPLIFLLELLIPIVEAVAILIGIVLQQALNIFGDELGNTADRLSRFADGFRTTWYNIQVFLTDAINAMIGDVEGFINKFVRMINNTNEDLGLTLRVQEVSIGRLAAPAIPQLRDNRMKFPDVNTSGITDQVSRRFNPIPAIGYGQSPMMSIGDMSIIDRLNAPGGFIPSPQQSNVVYNVNVDGGGMNGVRTGEQIVRELKNYERLNGSIGLR